MPGEESVKKWEQFQGGDNAAYSWMYKTYIQTLYRYGLRFTEDSELIKDCIQEVFTYIFKNRSALTKPGNVKVYLLVSLKNNLLRAIYKESVYENIDPLMVSFSLEPTVEEQFIEEETHNLYQDQIQEVLGLLTARQQEIIYYRFVQELTFDEICILMDLNYQSAQNLIQRSLKKIRDTYKHPPLFMMLLCTLFNKTYLVAFKHLYIL